LRKGVRLKIPESLKRGVFIRGKAREEIPNPLPFYEEVKGSVV